MKVAWQSPIPREGELYHVAGRAEGAELRKIEIAAKTESLPKNVVLLLGLFKELQRNPELFRKL